MEGWGRLILTCHCGSNTQTSGIARQSPAINPFLPVGGLGCSGFRLRRYAAGCRFGIRAATVGCAHGPALNALGREAVGSSNEAGKRGSCQRRQLQQGGGSVVESFRAAALLTFSADVCAGGRSLGVRGARRPWLCFGARSQVSPRLRQRSGRSGTAAAWSYFG